MELEVSTIKSAPVHSDVHEYFHKLNDCLIQVQTATVSSYLLLEEIIYCHAIRHVTCIGQITLAGFYGYGDEPSGFRATRTLR